MVLVQLGLSNAVNLWCKVASPLESRNIRIYSHKLHYTYVRVSFVLFPSWNIFGSSTVMTWNDA